MDTDIEAKLGGQQNTNLLLLLLCSFRMSPSAAISSHGNSFQPNVAPVESHACRWMECTEVFTDAEVLYEHITSTHIGRKSAGTLSLECKWFGCSSKASKRDHLTSHMRVHIDLKPHSCDVCSKRFKRVQDLKKHEKIHTEEHHREHKQSKAVTVPSSNASSTLKSSTPPLLSQDRQSHQPSHLPQSYGNWLPQGAHHPAYPTNYSQAPSFHYNPQNPHYPPLGLQHSRQDFDIAQLVAQQQSLNAAVAAGYPGGYGGAPMYPLNIPSGMQLYGPVPYPSHQEHQSHPYSMQAPHQPIPASYSQYSLPPAHHPSQLLKSPALNTLPTPANGPSLYPSLPPSYNFYPTIQVPQESPTSTLSPHSVHSASLSPAQSNSSGIKSEQSGEGMEHRRSFSGNAIAGTKRGFEEAGENFLGALRNKKFRDTDSLDTELDALTKFLITPDELLAPGHTPPQSHSSGSGSSPGSDYSPAEIESINELLLSLGQSLDSPPALGDSMPPSFIDSYHGFNSSKPHFPEPTFASNNTGPLYPSLTAFEPLVSQPTRAGNSHYDHQNGYGGNNSLRLSKSNVAPTILPNETRVPNYRHVERLMKAAPLHSLRSTSMDLDSDALEHLEEEEFLSHSHHKQRYTTSLRSTSLDTVTSATSSSDSLSSTTTHSIRPMPHNRSSGPRLPPIKIPSFSQSTTLPSIRSLVDLDHAVPERRNSLDTLASIATESIGGGGGGGMYPMITSPTGSMASGMERLAKGVTELGVEEAMVSDDEGEELETPTAAVRNDSESVEGEADLPTRSKKLRMESPEAMDQDEEISEEVQRANLKIKVEKAKRLAVIKLLVVLVNELYRKKVRKELERVASAGKKEVEGIEEVKEVKREVSSPAAVQEVVV